MAVKTEELKEVEVLLFQCYSRKLSTKEVDVAVEKEALKATEVSVKAEALKQLKWFCFSYS